MTVLRTDIEMALDDLVSNKEGMRFQGFAVVLGKMRWPELIAHERKKDFGLDAYAAASLTPEKVGKGLASSITPTLRKISDDAKGQGALHRSAKPAFSSRPRLCSTKREKNGERRFRRSTAWSFTSSRARKSSPR